MLNRQIALRITDRALARIAELLADREDGSVMALMYGSSKTYASDGRLKDERAAHWQFQVYGKQQAESLGKDYAERGWPFIHTASGITFCVPQHWLLEELDGKTLDFGGDVVLK